MEKTDVVCVGQAVIDCITRGREAEPYKENVYRAERIALSTGGDAVNESFALKTLGHSVRLVCGTGDDLAGNIILAEAKRRGVDSYGVTVSPDLITPVANLIVRTDGSRYSMNSLATKLDGYTPSPELLAGSKIVSFASLFRAPLDNAETVCSLIRAAKESGAVVSADTKLPTWRDIRLSDIAEVIPLIDYIFPNEKEAAFFSGKEDYAGMARAFHKYGVKNVIIKTGPEGCYASLTDGTYTLAARSVPVVDTTGAGDHFVAGFLSGLINGLSHKECRERALDTAAGCVQRIGACR